MKETHEERYARIRGQVAHIHDQADAMHRISETLSSGKEFSVRVTDHSLMPYIQPGDMMIFLATNYEKMRVGDFVLYRLTSGVPAVRRVIRKTLVDGHAVIITRSDVNLDEKDEVRAAQVIGRLAFLERHGKRIKGGSLNRGLLDWLTQYGTRHPLSRLGDLFFLLLPASRRLGQGTIEGVNKVDSSKRHKNQKGAPARRRIHKTNLDLE